MTDQEADQKTAVSRRGLLGGTAIGAAALSGGAAYLEFVRQATAATPAGQSAEIKPGDLDEYYGFGSSGQTGEVR
ncbi:MAG: TAT-dependent nitrous-oxide reductase, partial [Bradyrhizobium sp.]